MVWTKQAIPLEPEGLSKSDVSMAVGQLGAMASTIAGMASQLVFLENRAQVCWAKQSLPLDSRIKLVAITAEALDGLDECGLPQEGVSAYADTRQLACVEEQFIRESFSLAHEIESFIGERCEPARFEGPGFLSGQGYYILFSISSIATRAFLMRETIRSFAPDRVTVFEGEIDPWFGGDGYRRNPWLDVIEELCQADGFVFETLRGAASKRVLGTYYAKSVWRACRYARRKIAGFVRGRLQPRLPHLSFSGDLAGWRLLLVEGPGYDWDPALEALRLVRGVECFSLTAGWLDDRWWTQYYVPSAGSGLGGPDYKFDVGLPQAEAAEVRHLSDLFDDWLRRRPASPAVTVLGMNLFPTLVPHLRALTVLGPALARHADAVAVRALDAVKPDAVCFSAMPLLPAKRLAYHCRRRGIPVVCFQHGGAYGTHIVPSHELAELGHADYFLTYGEGIQPPTTPTVPIHARCVPVGSARIERMKLKNRLSQRPHNDTLNVLWVGELSSRNTFGGSLQVEDTTRYSLQRQCLQILGNASHVRVIYRPSPYMPDWQAIPYWLKRAKIPSIRTKVTQPLDDLIRSSDVVITDTSSGTVWNEVLALKKPLILYCDPGQTRLMPHFAADLERACYWCKSKEALVAAVHQLVTGGNNFVAELRDIDATTFVRNYVLHDGQCVSRVLSFLNQVCRNKHSVDNWEDSVTLNDKLES